MNESPPLALLGALFDVQRQIKPVPKASEMDAGKFGYMYASAADVVRYARAELAIHGLMVVFSETRVAQFEGARGSVDIRGAVFHQPSNETMPVSFALPYIGTKGRPDDKASQAAVTTAEARAYRLLLGLTTSDYEDEVASHVGETAAPITTTEMTVAPPKPSAQKSTPPPKPAQPDPEAKAEREAIQSVEAEEEADAEPDRGASSDEDVERFKASAKRLGLDPDSATVYASRAPAGAKLKDDPQASLFCLSDAVERGAAGQLADVLDGEIAAFKAKGTNPRKIKNSNGETWPEVVKTWAANQINF